MTIDRYMTIHCAVPLADAINVPIVLGLGFVVFAPITLFVSLVESVVLARWAGVRLREAFWPALRANVISTIAGLFVYALQDVVVSKAGIERSIPDFVEGYRWVAAVMVAIYWGVSSIVEWLSIRGSASALAPRAGLFRAVLLANVASYAFMGPLFYFSTRPTFSHYEVTRDTKWTANPREAVAFIDPEMLALRRIWVDGSGLETVTMLPAEDVRMNADATAFVFRKEKTLCAWRSGMQAPRVIASEWPWTTTGCASIAPAGSWIAYLEPVHERVAALRLASADAEGRLTIGLFDMGASPRVAWESNGSRILYSDGLGGYLAIEPRPNGTVWKLPGKPAIDRIAIEFVHGVDEFAGHWSSGSEDQRCAWFKDQRGTLIVGLSIGIAPTLVVGEGEPGTGFVRRTTAIIQCGYGLIRLGDPAPRSPTILPLGQEFVIEWLGAIHVIDWEHERIGLLARGSRSLTPRAPFRAGLD
jgi:hypothetical protein